MKRLRRSGGGERCADFGIQLYHDGARHTGRLASFISKRI